MPVSPVTQPIDNFIAFGDEPGEQEIARLLFPWCRYVAPTPDNCLFNAVAFHRVKVCDRSLMVIRKNIA